MLKPVHMDSLPGVDLPILALHIYASMFTYGKCYPPKCVFLRIRAYPHKDPPEPDFWQKNGPAASSAAQHRGNPGIEPTTPATYAVSNSTPPKTDADPEIAHIDLS